MIKTCTRCGKEKDESEFSWKNKNKGIRLSACKSCHSLYHASWYERNRDQRIKEIRKDKKDKKIENTSRILDYLLEHPCSTCGESDPLVLDFDHQRDKEYSISRLVQTGSWKRILKEIDKCVVLCANCHRRRTAKQFGWLKLQMIEEI